MPERGIRQVAEKEQRLAARHTYNLVQLGELKEGLAFTMRGRGMRKS